MSKGKRSFRTTITVPQDLKERMDAVKEQVNWSALACQAFEGKLAEIASRKGRKTVADVIQRLRVSKRQAASEDHKAGERAGQEWAKNRAEFKELENLAGFMGWLTTDPSLGRAGFFSDGGTAAYSTAEQLYFNIVPEHDKDREYAKEFWDFVLGEDGSYQAKSNDFLRGFAEGALAIWDEVKTEL